MTDHREVLRPESPDDPLNNIHSLNLQDFRAICQAVIDAYGIEEAERMLLKNWPIFWPRRDIARHILKEINEEH